MKRWKQHIPRIAAAAFIVALLVAAPLRAQQPGPDQSQTMQDAAARISAAISHLKVKRIIVFDFVGVGPGDDSLTLLGKNLADQFSRTLAASSAKLRVGDRSQIAEIVKNKGYPEIALLYPESAVSIAKESKAQDMVWGVLSSESGGIKIHLSLYKVSSDLKNIESAEVLLPLTDERKELLSHIVALDPLAEYAVAGKDGYSEPSCILCPPARFTDDAVQNHVEGTVLLKVGVGLHGGIEKIVVIRGLPDGLTEQAIKTVRDWRLGPVTGPDGKPARVQIFVDVAFHLTN